MGRSPSITVGDPSDGARVEHVKSRGLVRLVRWTDGRVEGEAMGLEVTDFCARLGITTDVLRPRCRYLFVAGAGRPGGGHVVTLFATEQEARAAFVATRRAEPGADAWGEVTELTTAGDVRRVCWFGTAGPEIGGTQAPAPVKARRWLLRRTLRGAA
jgi:hypothetical protein